MTTTTQTVLEVSGAEKAFGDTKTLVGAEFYLEQGELLALLGPNGAGKTTLVRGVAGRVRLDAGSATLLGTDLSDPAASRSARQQLGVVPQEIALYPDLTARENLMAFGRLMSLERETIEERTKWLLDWIGLEDRADDLSKTYSGGMKRRLNIGCSITQWSSR